MSEHHTVLVSWQLGQPVAELLSGITMSLLKFSAKPNTLESEMAERFDVSVGFATLYLEKVFPSADRRSAFSSWWSSLTEAAQFYVSYAMDTNNRGTDVAGRFLSREGVPQTGRHLDVGSGYGGTSVAFAKRGFETIAVETHPAFAAYTRANTASYNVKVYEDDFSLMDISKLGYFDVITCNEVLEHVYDPPLVIKRLCSLLSPSGVLMMEVPNWRCLSFIPQDGHYLQFGLTLLPRHEAKELRGALTGDYDYDGMGEYYDIDYYYNLLRAGGLTVGKHHSHIIGNEDSAPQYIESIMSSYRAWLANDKVPYFLRHSLQIRLDKYLSKFFADSAHARVSQDWEPFREKYLTSFWAFYAQK